MLSSGRRWTGVAGLVCLSCSVRGLSTPMATAEPSARPFDSLATKLKTISSLSQASAVLGWDQMVMMPPSEATAASRGAQLAALATVIHEKATSSELDELIRSCEKGAASLGARDAATVRDARRAFDHEAMISAELTQRRSVLQAEAHVAWVKARQNDDFSSFKDQLKACFDIVAETATATRKEPAQTLYDVCLDEFERGMPASRIGELFDEVEATLVPLLKQVLAAEAQPSTACLEGNFPVPAQEALNRQVVEAMGFDLSRGRIDVSVHPFTTSFSPSDVRITSRFSDKEWYQGLAGSIHEFGHSLYESNLRDSGLPVDTALSMGVHESQSLFWERHVGLSREFMTWLQPQLADKLGIEASAEDLYRAANRVSRGLIRVEADELTYPFHVILRYRLERALLQGDMSVDDLPKQWNAAMKELLLVDCPNDAQGCLQDVHWSGLAIGYFPTYLLGAIMAAQLNEFCRRDEKLVQLGNDLFGSGGVEALIEHGEFEPIRRWLKENIHDQGSLYPSMDELLVAKFGEPLSAKYFLKYLTGKYTDIYRL